MAELRRRSLLDFAIAASIAVLPVMLGMLLLVAVIRPAAPGARIWRSADDRYVSARHMAALKSFEQAIVERTSAAPAGLSSADVLSGLPQCRSEWGVAWRDEWIARWRGSSGAASAAAHVADQLTRLDAALLRFSAEPDMRMSYPLRLDSERWFAAAGRILNTDVEAPEYPGQRFRMRCADLAGALAALARADGRMLQGLAWRSRAGSAILTHWEPQQQMEIASRDVMRRNPWSGIGGCIYLRRPGGEGGAGAPAYFLAGERSAQRRLCVRPDMAGTLLALTASGVASAPASALAVALPRAIAGEPGLADAVDDPRWSVPPSLQTMLQPLEALRQPAAALYHAFADAGVGGARLERSGLNRIVVDGAPVDVGFSIDLTIDPEAQALAQKVAACYTGRHDVCRALGVRRHEDQDRPLGDALLEGALVRMAAVVIVDVASGRIEALAGALSPCARQDADGRPRARECDARLPRPARARPDALLNPAVFHDAMPASTIKPILAAAFLSDPDVGARWLADERAAMKREGVPARDSLRGQLLRSDSARFLDRMFCSDKGYAACDRPWAAQAAAATFGWNGGCATARIDCGKQDLLFGGAVDAFVEPDAVPRPATLVAYGRLMSEPVAPRPGAAMHLRPPAVLDAAAVRRCAAGADGKRFTVDDWEKCRGGALVDVVAEGWGQGHARATALGVAGMMVTLAAAANGHAEVHRPHLVEAVRGAGGANFVPTLARWGVSATAPNRVSHDAAEVIVSGLSYSHRAGTARTACEQVFDSRRCQGFDWLAGKTGTPSFPGDGIALDELQRLCRLPEAAQRLRPGVCGSLRPYKWYVAAYRTDATGSGPWNKVVAVLTERNWVKRTGQIHGVGDYGPNPSAEIAMQIAGRQVGLIAGSAP